MSASTPVKRAKAAAVERTIRRRDRTHRRGRARLTLRARHSGRAGSEGVREALPEPAGVAKVSSMSTQAPAFQADQVPPDAKVAVVAARFNERLVNELLE